MEVIGNIHENAELLK
ncbi:hypothetical protein ACTNNX_001867 [Campylobacter jejuni]